MTQDKEFFVQVTLTPEQARVVIDALDLYSRIHIGQFHTIREQFFERLQGRDAVVRMENCLLEAREHVFPELTGPGHSHSMSSPEVAEPGKIAWDVQQVIRHTAAWAKYPEGGIQVSFNEPRFLSKSVPRPVGKSVSILDRLADA